MSMSTGSTRSKRRTASLFMVLFAVLLTATLIPLCLYSVTSFREGSQRIRSEAMETLVRSNFNSARMVRTWIGANESAIRSAAQARELAGFDQEVSRGYVQRVNAQLPVFYAIVSIDKGGQQVGRSNIDKLINVGDRPYFKRVMAGDASAIQTGISKTTGKATFFVAAPIRDQEKTIVGALAGYAELGSVTDQITGGKIGRTGRSFLVDTDGLIIAHPNAKLVGTKVDAATASEIAPELFGKVRGRTETDGREVLRVTSSAGGNLVLVTQIDSDEVSEPIVASKDAALVFSAGAALFALALSAVFARTVSRRITQLAHLTAQLSKAKSVQQIEQIERSVEQVGGAFELRLLAAALRRVSESLKIAMNMTL